MCLLKTLKSDQLAARKLHKSDVASSLTSLISEAEMVGKNKRNDQPTDEEVVQTIKKFLKGIDESISACDKLNRDSSKLKNEKKLLESYLPRQLSKDELTILIKARIFNVNLSGQKSLGILMKWLNENYAGRFNGKDASEISKHLLT